MANEDKSIRFRIDADDSAFNQKMRNIQQRMKEFERGQQFQQRGAGQAGQSGQFSDAARRAFDRETQMQRQQLMRDEQQIQASIEQKERRLEKIQKIKQDTNLEQKKENDLTQEQINLLEKEKELVSDIAEGHRKVTEIQKTTGGGPTDGGDQAGAGGGKFMNLMRAIGAGAILKGVMNAVATGMQEYATREKRILGGQKAVLDYGARPMRELSEGRGSESTFWAEERARAANLGLQEAERQRNTDMVRAAGGAVGGVAMGIGGAKLGAMAGTAIMPGVGTAIGAGIGGLGGAALGFMGMGERGRAMAFDPKRYQAMLMEQAAGSSQQMEAGIMARDPRRMIGRQNFMQNVDQYSAMSRRLGGLTDREMFGAAEDTDITKFMNRPSGDDRSFSQLVEEQKEKNKNRELGWMRNQMNQGKAFGEIELEQEAVQDELANIFQAGGQQDAGQQGAGRAAAMNRQLNLTNVGNVMGRISGAGANAAGADEGTKRLLAEAVKLGVDASKMPVNMERMINVTSELATAGGGFSAMAAETFGLGVGGFSQAELAGAQSAFGEYTQKGKQGGGYEGQLGLGFLIGEGGKEAFGAKAQDKIKKDSDLMNMMNQYTPEELERDPALKKALMEKLGFEGEEGEKQFVKGMKALSAFKQTRTGEEQEAAEEYGKLIEGLDPDERKALLEGDGNESKAARAAMLKLKKRRVGTRGAAESRKGAAESQAGLAMTGRLVAGEEVAPEALAGAESEIDAALKKKKEGVAAEDEKGARARGQQFTIETLAENAEEFSKAAQKTKGEMILFGAMFEKLRAALDGGDGDITEPMKQLAGQLSAMAAKMAEDNASAGVVDAGSPEEQ